jgi:hypothetical protein
LASFRCTSWFYKVTAIAVISFFRLVLYCTHAQVHFYGFVGARLQYNTNLKSTCKKQIVTPTSTHEEGHIVQHDAAKQYYKGSMHGEENWTKSSNHVQTYAKLKQ